MTGGALLLDGVEIASTEMAAVSTVRSHACPMACAVLLSRLSGSALGARRCIPVRFTLSARRLQVAALAILSGAIEVANSRIGISVRGTCAAALAPAVETGGSRCRGPCWTPPTAPAAVR